MAHRYLVTTHWQNWGDQVRDRSCHSRCVFLDPSAAHEEAMRLQSQGVRGVVIYPFTLPPHCE